ncbi:MAG: phosphopantetheine adenylyltransferase [Thermoprotei archaeon]|nr:MAG: phosphopantetheine adenylyltransferase [Thermoprotei archaeon]
MFKKVCLGGTFSILHEGHKKLIRKAGELSKKLVIGITSDNFIKKLKKKHPVENFSIRAQRVEKLLTSLGVEYEIAKLDDPYGPAIFDSEIEAIVVSQETLINAIKANDIRRERGLRPLIIYVIEWVLADNGLKFSSTAIWKKLI